jgi:hypothetical protein
VTDDYVTIKPALADPRGGRHVADQRSHLAVVRALQGND